MAILHSTKSHIFHPPKSIEQSHFFTPRSNHINHQKPLVIRVTQKSKKIANLWNIPQKITFYGENPSESASKISGFFASGFLLTHPWREKNLGEIPHKITKKSMENPGKNGPTGPSTHLFTRSIPPWAKRRTWTGSWSPPEKHQAVAGSFSVEEVRLMVKKTW